MTNRKDIVERRKNNRFQVKIGAFVALRPHHTKLGQISDIGMGGLSFHYMANEELSNREFDLLDIVVTGSDFSLEKVPFETVSDFKINKVPFSSITIKRCSVKFGDLTENQRSQLEYFIHDHTTGTVH